MTADFARSPHSTNRAGKAILAHLATAATWSSHAAPRVIDTAQAALALSTSPITRQYRANSMVMDHATAHAHLRRASESLHDAVRERDNHLDFHCFFTTASPQQGPASPPLGPAARHR